MVATRKYRSILGSVDMDIGFPVRMRNTSGFLSPNVRAALRISAARRHSEDPVLALRLHPHGWDGPLRPPPTLLGHSTVVTGPYQPQLNRLGGHP